MQGGMLQPMMPNASNQAFYEMPQPSQSFGVLANLEKIVMIDDNSQVEKCMQGLCPCLSVACFPKKYELRDAAPDFKVGNQVLYTITQTRSTCNGHSEWTLKDRAGQEVNHYTKKQASCGGCCRICLGGPGLDVHDLKNGQKGVRYGDAFFAAWPCCNVGYDVRDSEERPRYFVGHFLKCFLCKLDGCCDFDFNACCKFDDCDCARICCGDSIHFEPIWDAEKTVVLKQNAHVMPCLKRYSPFACFLKDYTVIDFPVDAKPHEKSQLIAGNLMSIQSIF